LKSCDAYKYHRGVGVAMAKAKLKVEERRGEKNTNGIFEFLPKNQ